jgi:ligand-binding SRPBCC domain-containing protein
VSNQRFTTALGTALDKPTVFGVPSVALKLALGEAASVLLGGQNVKSSLASEYGFAYKYRDIDSALRAVLSDGGVSIEKSIEGDFVLKQKIVVAKPISEVFEFFSKAENLGAITPSDLYFSIRGLAPKEMKSGIEINYDIKLGPVPMRWTSSIEDWRPGDCFVDKQIKGPYAKWSHRHSFEAVGDNTIITDTVSYRLPFGFLGRIAHAVFVKNKLTRIFAFRSYFASLRFGEPQNSLLAKNAIEV